MITITAATAEKSVLIASFRARSSPPGQNQNRRNQIPTMTSATAGTRHTRAKLATHTATGTARARESPAPQMGAWSNGSRSTRSRTTYLCEEPVDVGRGVIACP